MKTEPTIEQLEAVFGNAPITPKGHKWVVERSDCYGKGWVSVNENEWIHCPEYRLKAIKIAQPTTLADLVGEDGQKNFYILHVDGGLEQSFIGRSDDGLLWIQSICEALSFSSIASRGLRWSNDPFTKYADAKEFVV